ncbi:MAG: T9SS type A sorting domain-containing protein [Bacteroidetes bacterium]|nr:T9SS type A sorting domain-containing protein [Bacteroidota bacterium]
MIRNSQRSIGKPLKGFGAYSIARQCPISGGNAVFKARPVFYLVQPNYKFDDRLLCNRIGITFRKKNDEPTQPQIKLYPNPTDNYFNIEYSIDKSCDATIQLINVFGQEVITIQLHNKKNVQQISTAQLGAGVYFTK